MWLVQKKLKICCVIILMNKTKSLQYLIYQVHQLISFNMKIDGHTPQWEIEVCFKNNNKIEKKIQINRI